MAVKQTAGRDQLGDFAPQFAQLNDDVLFGEVWAREDELDLKTRSIITVTCLVSKGLVDTSFSTISPVQGKRRDQGRDGGNSDAACVLRRLAQCLGGVSHGEGGLR